MSDIFISYASQDRDRIGALVEALEARGWSVFWDTALLPGETWLGKISSELDAARCVVVVWSKGSIGSNWVHEEAGEGQRRKILVPAMIDFVTIPLGFRSFQAANLVGWNGAAGHGELEKMLRGIERHVPLTAKAVAAVAGGSVVVPTPSEDNLVTIPAGTFWMGAQKMDKNGRNYDPQAEDRESPVHQVTFKDFRIARFPVTVREFAGFQEDGGYQVERYWSAGGFGVGDWPESWDDQLKNPQRPVVGVSWFEASAYCAWAGLRLPTEAEWERVVRGPRGSRYPWGNEPALDESRANYNGKIGHPTPAGQYPAGRSVEGVDDLLGNVWEWCSDWYADYREGSQVNPAGPEKGGWRVLRGGCLFVNPRCVRVSFRNDFEPAARGNLIGFRCAADA